MGLRLRPLHALAPAGVLVGVLVAALASAPAPPVGAARAEGTTAARTSSTATGPSTSSPGPAAARRGSPSTTSSTVPPTTTTVPPGPVAIVNGGSVTVAVPYLPGELNPATTAGANPVTAMIMSQVWPSPFVAAGPGDEQASTAFIDSAENVSVSPQTVVYTIDPKARWSNGDPIDVADFVAEWKAQLRLGPSLPAVDPYAGYADIASITGTSGGKVVTVVFKRPDADWQALFATLAPSRVAARYGWSQAFAGASLAHLVSGGPFAINRIVKGKELVLTRNPAYWGPPAHLQRIVFKVVRGEAAILAGLEAGRIDVAELAPGPALRNALTLYRRLAGSRSLSPTLWQLEFNLAGATTGQLAVRRAIAMAIDRVELTANSAGLLVPNVPTSGNHLYLAGAPGSAGNDGAYAAVDVPLADQLLAQVGYHLGPDGLLRDATGRVLVVHLAVPVGDPLVAEMTAQIRSQLLDAGIVVRIDRMRLSTLLSRVLPTGAYELALAPTFMSPFPSENATYYEDPVGPVTAGDPFALPPAPGTPATTTTTLPPAVAPGPVAVAYAAGVGSGTEPGATRIGSVTRDVLGYHDPAVDALLAKAFSDLNPLTMAGLYNQADRQIWADLPSLPLYQVPKDLVAERSLLNLSDSPTWVGPLWNAENWALQAAPAATSGSTASSTAGS